MTQIANLEYYRGETPSITFPVVDEEGADVDITGWSVQYAVRYRDNDTLAVDLTDAGAEVDLTGNDVTIALDTDIAPGTYVWWCRCTDDGNGGNQVLYTGTYKIKGL
jgi:hypothetical protein